jgi:hypothetical protein
MQIPANSGFVRIDLIDSRARQQSPLFIPMLTGNARELEHKQRELSEVRTLRKH